MSKLNITNATIVTAGKKLETNSVSISDGVISSLSKTNDKVRTIDANQLYLLPGFIDLHIHGREGFDTMEGSEEDILKFSQSCAQQGVTTFQPTTETATNQDILATLKKIKSVQNKVSGATIHGVHLEGPYLNAEAAGAQDISLIREADPTEYQAWLDLDIITQVTVAPEFAANQRFIDACLDKNILVSVGHSTIDHATLTQQAGKKVKQATHMFNGMSGFHHRSPGTVGGVLLNDAIKAEVITDLIHVHPDSIKILIKTKGLQNVLMVTDSIYNTGMPDGEYEALGQIVIVKDGESRLKSNNSLAGSCLDYSQGVRNLHTAVGLSLEEISLITSYNQAQQLHIPTGEIAPGKQADLVLLNKDLEIVTTIVKGNVVYQA